MRLTQQASGAEGPKSRSVDLRLTNQWFRPMTLTTNDFGTLINLREQEVAYQKLAMILRVTCTVSKWLPHNMKMFVQKLNDVIVVVAQ